MSPNQIPGPAFLDAEADGTQPRDAAGMAKMGEATAAALALGLPFALALAFGFGCAAGTA